jgi:ankyrin repeat protein
VDNEKVLIEAIWKRDVSKVRALLESRADPNALSLPPTGLAKMWFPKVLQFDHETHRSALMFALESDSVELVEILLRYGAQPNLIVDSQWSAVFWAVQHKKHQSLRHLLARGADVNLRNGDGDTPLRYALENEDLETAKLLLDAGADPNIPDDEDETALEEAVDYDQPEIVELLLAHGANPNVQYEEGKSLLQRAEELLAEEDCSIEIVELLKRYSAG